MTFYRGVNFYPVLHLQSYRQTKQEIFRPIYRHNNKRLEGMLHILIKETVTNKKCIRSNLFQPFCERTNFFPAQNTHLGA